MKILMLRLAERTKLRDYPDDIGDKARDLRTYMRACDGWASAAQSGPTFPLLMDSPSQDHHIGKIILAELTTPDIAQAKRFYGVYSAGRYRKPSLEVSILLRQVMAAMSWQRCSGGLYLRIIAVARRG